MVGCFEKMDSDRFWHPGAKVYGDVAGKPSALSETNKSVIARSLPRYGYHERPRAPYIVCACKRISNVGIPVVGAGYFFIRFLPVLPLGSFLPEVT